MSMEVQAEQYQGEQAIPELEQCDECGQHYPLYPGETFIPCPYCGVEVFAP